MRWRWSIDYDSVVTDRAVHAFHLGMAAFFNTIYCSSLSSSSPASQKSVFGRVLEMKQGYCKDKSLLHSVGTYDFFVFGTRSSIDLKSMESLSSSWRYGDSPNPPTRKQFY